MQMAHLFVKDIQPGKQLNETYLVTQPVLRNTSRGDLYIAMFLSDKTGKLNGRMWQATEAIYQSIPSEGFIQIRGKSELYQNALQVIINDLVVVDADKVSLEDYLPRTEKNIDAMFGEVKEILSTGILDEQLKALIAEFLGDEKLMKNFRTAPAAMKLHHAYLGGLLEHTHGMMKTALAILPNYPKIQSQLVLAAIFLHDIGKTSELSYEAAIAYTNRGQLVGHIVGGIEMINEKAACLSIDKDIYDSLCHIIVSHHGQYEFGSPKLPATAEAFMVNFIDDMDAKMNQVPAEIDADNGNSDWTGWVNSLQSRLYKKRPLG
jgi:3'-5' exoribonuclease